VRIRAETEGAALTNDDQSTHGHAKSMRRRMTPPEARLLVNVRRKSLGASVRRQHPVGPYVLDFYCPRARLAIEVDGEQHGDPDQREHDERRDVWLARQGISVLRFRAADIRDEIDAVLEQLEREIRARLLKR
jgi:very-short-patch-repair endonuclease